jgi:hypothetical protein
MYLLRWLKAAFLRHAPRAAAILPWLGGALMVLAAAFALHDWSFVRTQRRATATVTEDVAVIVPGVGVLYYPRLRFGAASGLVQVLGQPGTSEIEFPAGTVLPVLYRAGHPEGAIIGTVWRMYPTAIVLAVLGVALFDVGFVLRVVVRRNRSPRDRIHG